MKAKKELDQTYTRKRALQEVSKERVRGFYCHLPQSLFKKLNTHLAHEDMTKRDWLIHIIRDL